MSDEPKTHFILENEPNTDILLDTYYVGPDLTYKIQPLNDEVVTDFEFSVPKEIYLDLVSADVDFDSSKYDFSAIIYDEANIQIHLRQNRENYVLDVFKCYPNLYQIDRLKCYEQTGKIQLNGAILDYSYGLWENQFKVGVVVKGEESMIQLFDLTGKSVDPLVLGNSNITDLEIINNFIHVVDD